MCAGPDSTFYPSSVALKRPTHPGYLHRTIDVFLVVAGTRLHQQSTYDLKAVDASGPPALPSRLLMSYECGASEKRHTENTDLHSRTLLKIKDSSI